jgi:nitroreductase
MNVKNKNKESTITGIYEEGMPWNYVERTIMERRSIRRFKKDPIPDNMIRRILEAGRFAPSAGNCQPWKFIVIKSPEMLAEMEKDVKKFIKFVMFFLDYTRGGWLRRILTLPMAKFYIKIMPNMLHPVPFGLMSQISQDKAPVFHEAPVLILLAEDKRGVSNPATDIGICGQNMVLAAHSLGAGSCWIGLVKILMYFRKWRKRFDIKYPYCLNDCIAFGWQKPKADGEVPREVQEVTWFEKGLKDKPRIEKQGE